MGPFLLVPHIIMIICIDIAYKENIAGIACACFEEISSADAEIIAKRQAIIAEEYEPGAFYKRELRLILPVIKSIKQPISTIIIDGYVWLGHNNEPGLGARLHEALKQDVSIIGVAKNSFKGDDWSYQLLRGNSAKPLFITSLGLAKEEAAKTIGRMHGDNRLPTHLKKVDREARAILQKQV